MAKARSSYIQQLPGGAFRVSAYAGTDPLTGRQIRLLGTPETERAAQIEPAMLPWRAAAGRQPETDATAPDRHLTGAEALARVVQRRGDIAALGDPVGDDPPLAAPLRPWLRRS
jgi:hypothetical protein